MGGATFDWTMLALEVGVAAEVLITDLTTTVGMTGGVTESSRGNGLVDTSC